MHHLASSLYQTMTNKPETINFPKEFDTIQNLLNIIDVQHFKYGNPKNTNGKPSRLRLILVSIKFVFIAILAIIISLEVENRFVIGSSLISALIFILRQFLFVVLISIVVQTYRSSMNIKLIYDNFKNVLLVFKSLGVEFDFIRFRMLTIIRFFIFIFLVFSFFIIVDDMQKLLDYFFIVVFYPSLIIAFFVYFYTFQIDLVNHQLFLLVLVVQNILKMDDFQNNKIELIRKCRKVFNAISNSINVLNRSFGLMILYILVFNVVYITYNSYKIIIAYKDITESVVFYGKFKDKIHIKKQSQKHYLI